MDRGNWQAIVHGIAKSRTCLSFKVKKRLKGEKRESDLGSRERQFYLFILFLPVLGLHCCVSFSLVVVCGLLITMASLVVECGLEGAWASAVAAPEL